MRALVYGLLTLAACGPAARTTPADAVAPPTGSDAAPTPLPPVFPTDPIVEPGAPPNAPGLFGAPGVGVAGGPCLAEPATGALIPAYFLRPRLELTPTHGENLFEIRLHAATVPNDLVAYTTATTWTIPVATWQQMSGRLTNVPIDVSIRGGVWNGTGLTSAPTLGAVSTFRIAPVGADGTIVYWTSGTGTTASFKGFEIGDETVHDVLGPAALGSTIKCVGCHTSTPDGKFISFSSGTDTVRGDYTTIDVRSLDGTVARPPFLTASAATLLARTPNQEAPAYSAAHWRDGDHVALSMFPVGTTPEIVWTNLEATSTAQGTGWGVVARTGDPGQAGAAAWSHDGTRIAYTSAPLITSGMNADDGSGDLYVVPYNGGAGGAATKLAGASDPNLTEHYAAWSHDDQLIAFIRLPDNGNPYNNAGAEVYVVPAAGGTAVRLGANDPRGCAGGGSRLANTWPKWSPSVNTVDGITYYWLTFSSTRRSGVPQLFVAPITVDAQGAITTYPALYLWNQPATEHNHTPAWDAFDLVVSRMENP